MANNRMYLRHVPTGAAVYLGKRMGGGWYNEPEQSALSQLFEYAADNGIGQDEFALEFGDSDTFPRLTDHKEPKYPGLRFFESEYGPCEDSQITGDKPAQ